MTLNTINSASTTTEELLVGEQIIGQTSGAVAIVAVKTNNTTIEYISKNEFVFIEGETIESQESSVRGIVSNLSTPSFNISSNYKFRSGQEGTFYDVGSIKRNTDSVSPSKQIKVYFKSAYFDSTDDGDITTVNSYNQFNYSSKEIKLVDDRRVTDLIDIRPRVSDYTVSESVRSPLEFLGRSFDNSGQTAANPLLG